ncbi:hypothetical protein [Alicyclobacillus sp. ALC3]|uniref:hypothetical protein n=1 Tax=Alicyclobacillus sp. ALC3 TaxID=2796143 RepID=UPI0023789983|nr:hypothetical protein [Alicyclobacillus sp. ALC3]WDL98116.1 hypothetical protein JC200_05290 [Alicyclobacillus sp. ALC3]
MDEQLDDDQYNETVVGNDHDRIMNMWPRLRAVERASDEHKQAERDLANSVSSLRDDMGKMENRLTEKFTEGIGDLREETTNQVEKVDKHLTEQDEVLADLRVNAAKKSSKWPDAAKEFVKITGAVAGGILLFLITSLAAHLHY